MKLKIGKFQLQILKFLLAKEKLISFVIKDTACRFINIIRPIKNPFSKCFKIADLFI